MAAPLMSRASTAAAGSTSESPPVSGSFLPLGIVLSMTPSLGEVVPPPAMVVPAVRFFAVVAPEVVVVAGVVVAPDVVVPAVVVAPEVVAPEEEVVLVPVFSPCNLLRHTRT